MSKRLWKVEIERRVRFPMVVIAEGAGEARLVAERYAAEAEDDWLADDDLYVSEPWEVTAPDDLDSDELELDAWGASDGRTCKEWLHGQDDGAVKHAVPFCGGIWRLQDPWLTCDACEASARSTLPNLDAAWAENDASMGRLRVPA